MPESLDLLTIRTLWGLEYNVEAGRLPFDIVWSLDTDLEVATMFAKRGLPRVLSDVDSENVFDICDRHPQAIAKTYYIAGRSIVTPVLGEQLHIDGIPYDAIQISGWGFNPIVDSNKGSVGQLMSSIYCPRDDQNYRDIRPDATVTGILRGGKLEEVSQKYLFPGAYTEQEVIKKVSTELALWDILTQNGNSWELPFCFPLPLMVARYQGLSDPKGRPAYFYVTMVPFSGMRNGIIFDQSRSNISRLISETPRIAEAISYLNALGLAHNQPVMGNFCTSDTKGFLADMGTVTELDLTAIRHPRSKKKVRNYGRAYELSAIINGSFFAFNDNQRGSLNFEEFLSDLLFYYGALDKSNEDALVDTMSRMYSDPANYTFYLAEFLDNAEDKGILLGQRNVRKEQKRSLESINYWQNKMRQISRV